MPSSPAAPIGVVRDPAEQSQARESTAEELAAERALARYAILDTPPDEAFDDLAELARAVVDSPIGGVGFFYGGEVWFKSLLGAEAHPCTKDELLGSRPGAVQVPAGHATLSEHVKAGAVATSPCVTSDGYILGCIVVAGMDPGQIDEAKERRLVALAKQVVRLLELRRTLLSYHTVVDGAGHVVFHLDQTDRLVSLTPTWSQLSGFGVVRSVGTPLRDFVHPDDRNTFSNWLTQVRDTSVSPVQCRLLRLTDDDVPVEVLARPLVDEAQRSLGVVGVIADVSERHAREVETQHRQKLEALGRLSAGLAHEINTPIQFVGDNTLFLSDACKSMLDLVMTYRRVLAEAESVPLTEIREQIRQAEAEADVEYLAEEMPSAVRQSLEGVERVASLVRAMKVFSHPGTGDMAEADLNEALQATMTVARNQVTSVADTAIELGELPPVLCNIGDLNQAFLNLVINAADAIEESGRFGRITVSTHRDHGEAVVTISDTGGGVPEAIRRRIFEPFFTTKAVGRGTGQGLALARAVVEKHGGSIALDTEPGVGSTFVIRLPMHGRPSETEVSA